MSETAIAAAYRAVVDALRAKAGVWGERVYSDTVPHGAEYPYVWVFWSGGGELNWLQRRDAEVVLTVECIADDLSTALAGAQQIAETLNDKGTQDHESTSISGGTYWEIMSITEEDAVHLYTPHAGAMPIYQCGARYRLIMEEL